MARVDSLCLVVVRVGLDVLLVAVFAVKAGIALTTVEHAHSVVDLDVCLEVAKTGKGFPADLTLVAMLQGIVLIELIRRSEKLEAVGTSTVLSDSVNLVDVNFELSKEGKREVTFVALVGLPSHVSL